MEEEIIEVGAVPYADNDGCESDEVRAEIREICI